MFHSTGRNKRSNCLTCFFSCRNSSLLSFYRKRVEEKGLFVSECACVSERERALASCTCFSLFSEFLPHDFAVFWPQVTFFQNSCVGRRPETSQGQIKTSKWRWFWVVGCLSVMKSDNESHHESISLNISAFSNSHFCRAAWEKGFAALEEGGRDEKNNFYRRREGSDSQKTSVEAIGILSS